MSCCTIRALSVRRIAAAILFAALGTQSVQAQAFRPVEDGQIHEAYVPAVTGISALEAIIHQPPPPIIEKPPASCHPEAIWIKGYWAFDEDSDDFQWVGGCWRRPPRGRHWVDGFWHRVDEGWVWIRGLWSAVPPADLMFIDDAPPDPIDDDAPNPAGANYFWLAGYWDYDPQQGYVRLAGKWIKMDPKFVLVPANYTWRPEGYVFVSAYWDWQLEERGCTYQTIYVEPSARVAEVIYEPVVVVEPAVVVGWCYSYYPNYVYLVHHHYHHHHDWWYAHYDVPTWWGWGSWWSLSWHDHWGVWWWWSNPGYPHPHFMTAAYAARIAPPVQKNVFKVKNVYAPKIVTKNGVVTPKETLKFAKKDKSKGTVSPVVAAKTKDKLADNKGDLKDNKDNKDNKGNQDNKDNKDKDDKDDKDIKDNNDKRGNKNDKGIAKADTLLPGGTKSAKDLDDDPKNQPPKPTKKQPKPVISSGQGGSNPLNTSKGKGKDDDNAKGKSGGPPITVKGRTTDGDSKSKGKMDDKPDKTGGKSSPPIVPQGQNKGDQNKGKGKGDKDDNKNVRPPINPSGGDKPKDKDKDGDKDRDGGRGKDKPSDSNSSKKGGAGGGAAPGPSDTKPKEKPGGGGDKGDKDNKKKDKNGRN